MRNPSPRRFVALILSPLFLLTIAGLARSQAPSPAASNPLTVERIYDKPSLSGSQTQGIEWSRDGKQLSFVQKLGQEPGAKNELRVLDVTTGQQRVLIDAEKLATLMPAPKTPPTQRTGLGRV